MFVTQTNPRISLVVFQQNVIPRLVCFDKAVFKMQSIFLGLDEDILKIINIFDENISLRRIMHLIEIRRHTTFQILRLTYINNLSRFIEILVYARGIR